MRRRLLVPITVVLLVLTGLWGQYLASPERLSSDFSTSLYQIMMLFILDGDWTTMLEQVPLQLEIVRFLAPLVLFASLLLVFAETTRVSLTNYFVRFYSGHTVIIGLGQKSWQFLQTFDDKKHVVVIELSAENRLSIKREWVDLFVDLLTPICNPTFDLGDATAEPVEIQYVLTP